MRGSRWEPSAFVSGAIATIGMLILPLSVGIGSAQVPARVETPYTLIDAESRTFIQTGVETPVRGNGPLTGYGYLFLTRPHVLHKDLYLRLVIPPGYFISELARDHWPSQNSAIGFGLSGGLWADSQVEFQDGRFEKEESEAPRVYRRLHSLRGWGHDETEQIFSGGAGARGADGVRAYPGTRVAVGGDHLDRREDRMCG